MAYVRSLAAKYEAALQSQLKEQKKHAKERYAASTDVSRPTSAITTEQFPVTSRRPRGTRVRAMTHVLEMRVREEAISKFLAPSTSPITSASASPKIPDCLALPSAKPDQPSYEATDPASRSSTLTTSFSSSQSSQPPDAEQLLEISLDSSRDPASPVESPVCGKSFSHMPSVSSHHPFHSFDCHSNSNDPSLSTPHALAKNQPSQFPSPPVIDDIPFGESSSEYCFSDGSVENVQPVEDLEADDLDNIEGVEHVEDCDSQGGLDSDSETDTVRRADTIRDLDLDIPYLEIPKQPDVSTHRQPDHVEALDDSPNTSEQNIAHTRAKLMRRSISRRPRPQSAPLPSLPSPSKPPRSVSSDQEKLKPYREECRNAGGTNRQSIDRVIVDSSSLKKLPKAKVMIARKRSHSINSDVYQGEPKSDFDSGIMPHSSPAGLDMSTPDKPARRLVREYSNPKELFEGPIRMLGEEEEVAPIYRKPSPAQTKKGEEVGTANRRNEREGAYKKRYDEFLDAEEIETRRHGKIIEDLSYGGNFAPPGASKEKYRNKKKLFGGKRVSNIDKERHRAGRHDRHVETIRRRSTFVSGALDRVSMAADPWIDFITDANAMPGTAKARGPFRRAMKRLFRLGKQDMIRY